MYDPLHEFVYEFRGNNTYIILDRTTLIQTAKNESLRIVDNIDFSQAWNQ